MWIGYYQGTSGTGYLAVRWDDHEEITLHHQTPESLKDLGEQIIAASRDLAASPTPATSDPVPMPF